MSLRKRLAFVSLGGGQVFRVLLDLGFHIGIISDSKQTNAKHHSRHDPICCLPAVTVYERLQKRSLRKHSKALTGGHKTEGQGPSFAKVVADDYKSCVEDETGSDAKENAVGKVQSHQTFW